MALTDKTFITLANLAKYDEKIKNLMDSKDSVISAKALKSVIVDTAAHTVKFYREEEPVGSATPAYTLDLSGYDTAIDGINTKINTINGSATTPGSIAKAVADAVSTLNNTISAVDGRVTSLDTKVGTIPSTSSATTVIGYVDAKVKEVNGANDAVAGRVSTLEGKVTTLEGGDNVTGSVSNKIKTVKDALESSISAVDTKAGQAKDAAATNAAAIAAINNTSTGILAQAKTYTDGKIGALPEGKATVVAMVSGVESTLSGEIDAVESRMATAEGKITTLIGSDANKSVRTIANEELAAQLLTGDSNADFTTLQEIARWIEDHPEDAAAMNSKIAALETKTAIPAGAGVTTLAAYADKVVGTEASRATSAENALSGRITNLESAVGSNGSVANMISNAVNALDYTDNVTGDIVTSVSETNGVIAVTKATLTFATDEQIAALFA